MLGVSASGYYAWQSRPRSARAQADEALLEQIQTIHGRSRGTNGAPHIYAELATKDGHIGPKRGARLMQAAGVVGGSRRAFVTTMHRHHLLSRTSHVHYQAISKVVEQTCGAFGIRYAELR